MKRLLPVVFVAAGLGFLAQAQVASDLQLLPQYVPGELLITLREDASVPDTGSTPEDLYTAAGVTEEQIFPRLAEGTRVALLRLKPGGRLGTTFQIIQRFDFGAEARWSLASLGVNWFGCAIPEGCPGVLEVSRVFNMSTRAEVRTGESVVIGGLIIPGEFARLVVFKVRGPSLESFGLNTVLANPRVRLHRGQEVILENDDWGELREFELNLALAACPAPDDPRESMIVTYLDPGAYTAIVSGVDGEPGVALLEMYMVDAFRVESAVGP